MKVNQIINEMTSGSVATVAKPLGEIQKRPDVKGLKPVDKTMFGKNKKKGPYANSLLEGKVKELQMDLSSGRDGLSDAEFKKKYGKSKQEVRKSLQNKPKSDKPVQEAKLDEDDLILIPGQGGKRKTGFVPHGQSRVDHEVEMARSDVLATIKNAKAIYELLRTRSEDEGLEGWVQEKLIKANDYLNSVKEYYDEKNIHQEMSGGVIAGGGVGESLNRLQGTPVVSLSDFDSKDDKKNKYGQTVPKKLKSNDPRVKFHKDPKPQGVKEEVELDEASDTKRPLNFTMYPIDRQDYKILRDPKKKPLPKASKEWGRDGGEKKMKKDLTGVAEGAKVDRMVQHIKKSEIKTGKGKDEAEDIAWATVNKRGYLDNKNKKAK